MLHIEIRRHFRTQYGDEEIRVTLKTKNKSFLLGRTLDQERGPENIIHDELGDAGLALEQRWID